MSFPIHGSRSVFWSLFVISSGVLMIVAGMMGRDSDQNISASPTTIQVLDNEVHTYLAESSIPAEITVIESEPVGILRVKDTVQSEEMLHLPEAVVVVKKDAVDRPLTNKTRNQKKVKVTDDLVRVEAPITAKKTAKPKVVRKRVKDDSGILKTAQAESVQTMGHLTPISLPVSVVSSVSNDHDSIASTSFNSPQSITTDGLNLYVADTNNHKIRMVEIATGRVGTLAGSGAKGDADGFGADASFNHPRGVVADGFHLYVTDTGNHAIRKINLVTGEVITLAGSGEAGLADKAGTKASFNSPRGIAIMGKDLFVADYYNQSIRRVDIETGSVTTALPKQGWLGSSKDKLPYFPGSIAIDDDTMYVADYDNHTIHKIQLSSGKMDILAGSGRVGSAMGTGKAASFNYPSEIAIVDDALYVADSGNHTIRKVEVTSGKVTKLAGSGSNGTDEEVLFGTPFGITPYGNKLFVADQGSHKIHQVDLTSSKVRTMAGSGQAGAKDSEAIKSRLPEQVL